MAAAGIVLAGALINAGQARAQEDQGYWRAASAASNSTTSDITIAKNRVTIDFLVYTLAPIRRLKPVEVSAVFDADVNAGISGQLYRLKIPAGQRFLHKNTLCGSEDTQWMATYVTGRTLEVAFLSGEDMPEFTFEAISKSQALCGTYTYAR